MVGNFHLGNDDTASTEIVNLFYEYNFLSTLLWFLRMKSVSRANIDNKYYTVLILQ